MSRLDQHVAVVRNRLAFEQFVRSLATASFVFAVVCLVGIVLDRALSLGIPQLKYWFLGGLAVTIITAIGFAIARRPNHHAAAVAIDQKLGLKEKFSTALHLRTGESGTDPFALATVLDAERTAQDVILNYYRHFPMRFPRAAYGAIAVGLLAVAAFTFMKPMDLFGQQAVAIERQKQEAATKEAENRVKQALANIEAVPRASADLEAVKQAKVDLQNLLKQPIKDPGSANRSAMKALQDVRDAIKQQIENQSKFAAAATDAKLLKDMAPDPQDKGPIADAQRAMSSGDFAKAAEQMKKAVEQFEKMDPEQQKKAAEQMQKMAQQMQQLAKDPQKLQQQMQQQLQQMGMNQQQAQQLAQQMQQAAQGNQQAQQQLQQMAQQAMQGMNPQQQQAVQQAMQEMQQQAQQNNAQQNMAQAMQQMAQAMQQAQQQQQGNQQQQQGQQANQQQQGQQQQGGQQPAGQQQMQQAMQQMQQQMQQMDQAAQELQEMADARQGLDQAIDEAAGACNNPGDGQGQDGQLGAKDGLGEWKDGDPMNKGAGMGGGPGIAAGDRSGKQQAPFGVKTEKSPSKNDKNGKILANTFIKDNKPIKGSANADLKQVAAAAEQEAADEVDTERVGRAAQNVVKEYFGSMGKDAPAEPAPKKD